MVWLTQDWIIYKPHRKNNESAIVVRIKFFSLNNLDIEKIYTTNNFTLNFMKSTKTAHKSQEQTFV